MSIIENNSEIIANVVPKKKKTGIIAGAAAAVIVGGSGVAYAAVPAVHNTVNMAVMKPERYCASVYQEIVDNAVSDVERSSYGKDQAVKASLKIAFDDKVMDDMRNQLESDLFKELTFDMDVFSKGTNQKADISVSADGRNVAAVDYIQYDGMMYMQMPELSEKYISYDYGKLLESYGMNTKLSLPSSDDITAVTKRYGDIMVEFVSGAETTIEKNYCDSVDGVDYKYNRITTVITPEYSSDFINRLADEVQNDDALKRILTESYGMTDESYSDFVDSIREEADSSDNKNVDIITLVDANGDIRGISLSDDEASFGFVIAKNDDNLALDFSFSDDESESSLLVKAKESDNTYTGTLVIRDDDEEISMDFENFKIINKRFVTGTVSADISEITDGDIQKLALSFEYENNKQKISTEISGAGVISVEYEETDPADREIVKPENVIDAEENAESYLADIDVEKALSDMLKALGVNEEYISTIVGMLAGGGLGGSLTGGYDESNDWNEEDFDWNDEELNFDFDDMM